MTKGNAVPEIGSRNRKRTSLEKLVKFEKSLQLMLMY